MSSEILLPMFTLISRKHQPLHLEITLIRFLRQPYRLYDIRSSRQDFKYFIGFSVFKLSMAELIQRNKDHLAAWVARQARLCDPVSSIDPCLIENPDHSTVSLSRLL